MDPSCRLKGVDAHFGRSARIETKAESICLLLYRELEQDLNAKFRYFFLLLGNFTQENERSPYGQTAPKKEYYQYRPDHTFACIPEPGKQDWQCSGKDRRDQEGPRKVVSVSCAARKQTMGEIMAETKGRTKHEGARDERKAESKAR